MRTFPLLCVLVLMTAVAQGQLLDSLALFAGQPAKPVVKIDSRGSFIGNRNVQLLGLKIGLEHAGRLQYGIGYSFLQTPVRGTAVVPHLGEVSTRLRLGYVTPYVEYAFYQRGPWEIRIPVQFGFGGCSLIYRDAEGRKQKLDHAFVFLYEPSMTVQYRFAKYFGLGAGWGYRLVFTKVDTGEPLTAPIYLFGLKVFFGDIWKDLRAAH